MHAAELTAGHRQVARDARADREHDRVVGGAELVERHHVDAEPELDPLGAQLLDPALDEALLDLELRNAEANESAGRLVALVDDHLLTGAHELLRAGETGGPGSDDADAPACANRRRLRDDPAFVPGAIDDRALDLLDRHRVAFLDLEHA